MTDNEMPLQSVPDPRPWANVDSDDTADTLSMIHARPDGYINFCRKTGQRLENLCAIQAGELRAMLPAIAKWITHDSYYSLHSSYATARWDNEITGLPHPKRKAHAVQWLNACFVDLDCGRPNDPDPIKRMSWPQTFAVMLEAQEKGIIPPATMMARSGRGLYALWLLVDDQGERSVRAWPENCRTVNGINRALANRLQDAAACTDCLSAGVTQLLRVPGSINSKAGDLQGRVMYWLQGGEAGGFLYSLPQLTRFLGLPYSKRQELEDLRPIKDKGSAPNRARGSKKTGQNRAQDLLAIERYYNGFKKGQRRNWLRHLAGFMYAGGYTYEQTLQAVADIAGNCHPPYPTPGEVNDVAPTELVGAFYAGLDKLPMRMRNALLANTFGVTEAMAEELGLRSIVPTSIRDKRKRSGMSPRDKKQAERALLLCQLIRKTPGRVPSSREAYRFLRSEGIACCLRTVASDLRALEARGIITRPAPGSPGRPRKGRK